MRHSIFCLLTILSFVWLGCRSAATPVSVSNQPISINDRPTTNMPLPPSKPFSEMSWATSDGRVQKLGDLGGKAVILDFWATYCEPCKREIPHLNSLVAKYGSDNLEIVGLNVGGEEDRMKIPKFVAETRIDYSIAFPDNDLTSFIFATQSDIPQTAVFDRRGALVRKIVGFNDAVQKELDAAVEQAVAAR
jgi:thiol-disulfide isomerase/thioredoxin